MEMVANGNRQRVGGIEKLRVQVFPKQVADHLRDLVFGGIAIARNGLFDAPGCVFHNRNIARQRSRHHYALRPAQLQHRLHVFAEKRVFNRHLVGVRFVDEPQDGFVEFLELQLVGAIFVQLNHAVLHHAHHPRFHRNDAITGNLGAGVNTEDNFFGIGRRFWSDNHDWAVVRFAK